jgi:nucleotide-binding universal stress UspA family protein
MLPFRKILFPVDFSDRCRAMAPVVRETVRKFDAELVLLHAVDPVPLVMGSMEASASMPLPDFSEIHRRQEQLLTQFSQEWFPGMKPTLLVEDGEAGRVITNAVRHHGADLVMLPTHGHGALRRFLLGSVTAKILHDVDCAVWTDAPRPAETATFPYGRVLCALNADGDEAAAVLRAACSIAKAYEAHLSILHIVETPPAAWEVDYAPYRQAIMEAADEKLRRLRQETGIHAPYEIASGRPPDEVRRVAKDQGADLIVTGRGHAQDGLGRVWSHLYGIIREAPCPVLSI